MEREAAGLVEKARAVRAAGGGWGEGGAGGAGGEEGEEGEGGGQQPDGEVGGPKGPEPTRFGDWERDGRCTDF